jgi:hypothetical protein
MTILSQAAPFAVALSGQKLGARPTWLWVAGMLVLSTLLGFFLFRHYGRSSTDENSEFAARISRKTSWTRKSTQATLINAISAAAIGTVLGPLVADIHRRGLNQGVWVGYWGIGSIIAGAFMMFVWSRVANGLRDRGLLLSTIITAAGAVFEVLEHNRAGGAALLAGGLVVSLGANTFENSVYTLKPSPAEAIAMNSGRALGFSLGAQVGLFFLAGSQYTWTTLAFAAAGILVTILMRKHWVQPIEHPLTLRSAALWVTLVFGAAVVGALIVVGGGEIAMIVGVTAAAFATLLVRRARQRKAEQRR